MKPHLRVAERADLDVIIGFMGELQALDGPAFDGSALDVGLTLGALQTLVDDASLGRVWVVEVNGEAVGYAILTLGYSLEFHGRDAVIDELYLVERYRGRGLGTAVLGLIEGACRVLGVRALHLEVERTNVGAQRFYHRLGFQDHDRYLLSKRLDT
jgi:ribosomal protein S18 acetylase RimI-like enzyme